MSRKQCDTLRSHNVIMVIDGALCLFCKAVLQRPIIEQHSIPDFGNELGKQSFSKLVSKSEHRGSEEGEKNQGLGAFGLRHLGFNQALGKRE